MVIVVFDVVVIIIVIACAQAAVIYDFVPHSVVITKITSNI